MTIELISAICTGIATTLITTITTIMESKKAKKEKDFNKRLWQENQFEKTMQELPAAINEAEAQVGGGNGVLKKTLVIQDTALKCTKRDIPFNLERVSEKIEEILSTPQKKLKGEKNEESEIDTQY